jgi:nitroreductase
MDAEHEVDRLVRYATLAASSHNTQPWRFEVGDGVIRVFADARRQLRVADPDRRELFLSAGCAVENLAVAAEHHGYATAVTYDEPDGPASVGSR